MIAAILIALGIATTVLIAIRETRQRAEDATYDQADGDWPHVPKGGRR